MTDYARLIAAARAVLHAERPDHTGTIAPADWLRRQADQLDAKQAALGELRAALEEIDGAKQ
jgi:hypothetical protein